MKPNRPRTGRLLGTALAALVSVAALTVVPTGAAVAGPLQSVSAESGCVPGRETSLVRLSGEAQDPIGHPVLLVHGWLSTTVAATGTDGEIADSPFARPVAWSSDGSTAGDARSLQQRLAALPDTTVFAFDYSSLAALWVGDTAVAPALAGAIECLAQASGQDVDIVAHSMGGLAVRLALAGSDNGVAQHVGQVITVATPSEGSAVASTVAAAGGAVLSVAGAGSALAEMALPVAVGLCNRELESDTRVGCDIPPSVRTVLAVGGEGGRALQAGSHELAHLPAWPASVPVHAIAGDFEVQVRTALVPAETFTWMRGIAAAVGLSLHPLIDTRLSLGDGIVETPSALAGANTGFVATCAVDADLTTVGGSDRLRELMARYGGIPPLAGPCAHDRLFENDDVVRDILITLDRAHHR